MVAREYLGRPSLWLALTLTVTLILTLTFVALASALEPTTDSQDLGSGDGPFVDGAYEDDPELEACPRIGIADPELSACFTRVFKQDILPHLRQGIPTLEIRSVDPVTIPYVKFTFLDIGIIRWIVHVREMVITGLSDLSWTDVVIDSNARTISGLMTFPRIEGRSDHTTVDGHVFGVPLRWFTKEGAITFRINELSAVTTMLLRPTKSELIRFVDVKDAIKGFNAEAHGLGPPIGDRITNWFMARFWRPLFDYIIRPGFQEIFRELITSFLGPTTWRAILGEFEWK